MLLSVMKRLLRWRPDPLVTGILVALVAGLLIHAPAGPRHVLEIVGDLAVATVFFVYGMRLRTSDVLRGLRNVRLHGLVLISTYVFFPLVGFGLGHLTAPFLGEGFALGFLYLSLLPSTIQSSVTMVSIARGNVAAAVTSATISNILGMFLTPLLVMLFLDVGGASGGGLTSVLLKLLLPFILGQCLQPFVGNFWRAHPKLVRTVDNTSIILIVFSSVLNATAEGAWKGVTLGTIVVLSLLCCVMLAVMLGLTWWTAGLAKLSTEDRIVVLMCGSKKSLATGLPMAKAIFPGPIVAPLTVPVVVFHQLQILVCAIIARRLAKRP
ncbi:solute carrier family 10 (sodium/bile acid cotransporter), member 7 [Actinobaculum suis]|uniref:Solute carrier family 10 (Sodium/bile acid cotransporter), member 7 n=2 Tax=Actinobaculum suis TaxID=1657 RepID=A0A1G7BZ70_9ACTO|nr:solute carrier family 10 (sodium/bile acid cotransporter), member 7 [Actinobaculum suis]